MSNTTVRFMQGNDALVEGAIVAGARFFAGYPITPASEITEGMSVRLPLVGGVFLQMEDEIASMGAAIGASMAGAKCLTSTAGPGFSLKQEGIGIASMMEIPVVIVDVMRGGPASGMSTLPSQMDVMQARWGCHGDHPIIVLSPATVPSAMNWRSRHSIWLNWFVNPLSSFLMLSWAICVSASTCLIPLP